MEKEEFPRRSRRADRLGSLYRILHVLWKGYLKDGVGKVRNSELKKGTGLSPKALAQSLDELEKEGRVERIVDVSSRSYPVPVYYKLTQKGRRDKASSQVLFVQNVRKQIAETFNPILGTQMSVFVDKLAKAMNAILLHQMAERIRLGQPWVEKAEDVNMILKDLFWVLQKNLIYLNLKDPTDLRELNEAFRKYDDPENFKETRSQLAGLVTKLYKSEIETFFKQE
jgi:DNA-binding HxlR family transcriptional regulator